MTWWEFYCEGVSVNWSYTSGLQITLNVTRGVPLGEDEYNYGKRFNEVIVGTKASDIQSSDSIWSFWGQSVPFRGGYFGEQNLATAIANSSKDGDGGGDDGGDGSFGYPFACISGSYKPLDGGQFGHTSLPRGIS